MSKIEKTIELAADIATTYFGIVITPQAIKGRQRYRHLVVARQVCMYFLRVNYAMTLNQIGKIFGKDHSTAIHSLTKVNDMIMTNDEAYCEIYENMVKNLELIECELDTTYTVIFPKYADHKKLMSELNKFYNIKTIKYERAFHDSVAAQ